MNQPSHPKIYDQIGSGYRNYRAPDARIAARIHSYLGDSNSVCNVGAGTGSYEPDNLDVTAVEPSECMIRQRTDSTSVVKACAENLPFDEGHFDASMAVLTVHHWTDARRGLLEMKRISKRQVVLTFDPDMIDSLWLVRDYLPEIIEFEKSRAIPLDLMMDTLQTDLVYPLMIPWDCTDGFQAAYWRRPEQYLDANARKSISTLSQIPAPTVSAAMSRLAEDLESGSWAIRNSEILNLNEMDFGYRIVVANDGG